MLVWLVWLIEVALKGRTDLASRETQHGAKTQLAAKKQKLSRIDPCLCEYIGIIEQEIGIVDSQLWDTP